MRFVIYTLIALFGLYTTAHAQTDERIAKASLVAYESAYIAAGESVFAVLRLDTKKDWHTYWQNPGDSGIPTSITWELPDGLSAGPIHWPRPERQPYDFLMNYGYSGLTYLFVPITASKDLPEGEHIITANAEWLVCKDICIPESDTVSLTLTHTAQPLGYAIAHEPELLVALNTLPKPHSNNDATISVTDAGVTLQMPWDKGVSDATFFPINDGIIENTSAVEWSYDEGMLRFAAAKGTTPVSDKFVATIWIKDTANNIHYLQLTFQNVNAVDSDSDAIAAADNADTSNVTFIAALLFAFIGGIILNIMPCVLPILSLKALSIANESHDNMGRVRANGLAYTLGILVSFALIAAILLALKTAGMAIGWGFQLQSPAFIIAMIYVLFLVGLNLSGMFELPSRFSGVGGGLAEKNGLPGSFFTGVLAVLVATPCTAPFMAPAIGFAFTQATAAATSIFLMLGLGLAFPYLIISFIPVLTRAMPKPGPWMLRFKQFLAFPLYATVIWLAWVLLMIVQPEGAVWVMATLVVMVFALWLLQVSQSVFWRMITVIMTVAVMFYSITIQQDYQKEIADATPAIEQIEALRSEGKAVFVDVTADWCITCKINERVAIKTQAVQQHFADREVTLVVLDWTQRDDTITAYLERYSRGGVPLYVYYPANGGTAELLPQILTQAMLLERIK